MNRELSDHARADDDAAFSENLARAVHVMYCDRNSLHHGGMLKGQSIGSLNPGGLVDTLLRKVIVQNGLSPERDFILLNMGGTPERYAALKSGTLAASMLSAPHSLRAEKEGFTKIAATRDYVDVPGTALVAHADKIKKQPEMIKRFLRATLRSRCWVLITCTPVACCQEAGRSGLPESFTTITSNGRSQC